MTSHDVSHSRLLFSGLCHPMAQLFAFIRVGADFLSKIQISPAIRGTWRLNSYNYYPSGLTVDSTEVYLSSTDTLLYDTKYNVSVPANSTDARGLLISAPFTLSFTTNPFQVSSVGYSSSTGSGGFTVYNNFNFSCNGSIDTSTIRQSVAFAPVLPFDVSFPVGSNIQSFTVNPTTNQMQRATTYTITVNTTLRSKSGVLMKHPYSITFTTGS